MDYAVSVIIPVYNAESYIEETLKSVINQDFKNFEIIIVNDGSTDSSLNIIENILNDSHIPNKIINQENKGVSQARNIGLENAQGEYIIFVDDDDIISKNHISCLFENTQNNDGSFTKMLKINEMGDIIENMDIFSKINEKSQISAIDLIKLELKMEIPFSFCQIMYKKELITEKFNMKAIYGEDTEFALKNLINMDTLGLCPKATYFYKQRESSSTNKAEFKRFYFINILEDLANYYIKNDHKELADLIKTNRIPKAIFGNLMYFFYKNYDYLEIMDEMNQLKLFNKLKNFKGESKFNFKIKLFLFNPKLYYKIWKKFKDDVS